jgi:hypothetical protein
MKRQNSNKEIAKRENSKPKVQQSPVITTTKGPNKPTNNPYSSKNTFDILNKMNNNYKDIKEVNIAFNDNKGKAKPNKHHIELRPSTPSNKKTPSRPKKQTDIPKKVVYTKEKAAIALQRSFRRYIKVRLNLSRN